MTPKTVAALDASIEHWKQNVNCSSPRDMEFSNEDCALCALFYDMSIKGLPACCVGCPVREKTGLKFCLGSPYSAFCNAHERYMSHIGSGEAVYKAAKRELQFLESLRSA